MVVEARRIALTILIPLLLALSGCSPPSAEPAVFTAQPGASSPASPDPHGSVPVPSPDFAEALDRGRRAQRNGDLVAAMREYRVALAGGRDSEEAGLRLGEVALAAGDPEAARAEWQQLLDSQPSEPWRSRARLLLAMVDLAMGDGEAVLRGVDASVAPDGLADLAVLQRAEAAAGMGNVEGAIGELGRPEMVNSTNRILLERAGDLAGQAGYPALAARLLARAAGYPAWTVDRVRVLEAAAQAFEASGQDEEAIERYRSLMESYGWMPAAERAGERLIALGGLSYYHQGLLLGMQGDFEGSHAAFVEAAQGGRYAGAAARQLWQIEDTDAWRRVVSDDTPEAYHAFHRDRPDSPRAAEARFREGMGHYEADSPEEALTVWEASASEVKGEDRARMLLWAARALERLGRGDEARVRLQEAGEVHPAGYYALRARALLTGDEGWPGTAAAGGAGGRGGGEEAEGWLAGWAGPGEGPAVAEHPRVRRGLGLVALGLYAEAEAEFDGLIDESRGEWFLFRLAEYLGQQGEWAPSSRAANRLIALSPARTVTEAPLSLQRLVYPMAYPDLVAAEADRTGLDPLLLLALIYQESRFDPFARSPAEARGLSQVIPSTGRGIADALERPGFTPADLYRPDVSLQFGAWYLSRQAAGFEGDLLAGLAAYNAGAGPVPRWSSQDADLFVERIDYPETREYVRRVYLHYSLYRTSRR